MKSVKNNFSAQAQSYSQFRPHYPDSLYAFLFSKAERFDCAWDCGTGNGQVAEKLSEKFQRVYATDISKKQLQYAIRKPNIIYLLSRAEKTEFPGNTFDLITVAQALHWFDLDAFYKEVKRVAKANAIIAAWVYKLLNISPEIDAVILDFYNNIVGSYWDPERKIVDEEYKTIPFPFEEIETPVFQISVEWKFEQLMGYLNTWSSVQKYIKENNSNPADKIEPKIKSLWKKDEAKKISFPLYLRAGRIA